MKAKSFYKSILEASAAVQKSGIKSKYEYMARYKEDPQLPSNPNRVYKLEWDSWYSFLGKAVPEFYLTLNEASAAVQKLGITSFREYKARYKEDPRLPPSLWNTYKSEWSGWAGFLGKAVPDFYPTLNEASAAVQKLGITSFSEYMARYKEDPRLPSAPNRVYKLEWESCYSFFGKAVLEFYPTLNEASAAAQKLGITSFSEYKARYKEDPRLPSTPNRIYKLKWDVWESFLGKAVPNFYRTLKEVCVAAQNLGIASSNEYLTRHKEDVRLSSTPWNTYKSEWNGWDSLLMPIECSSLDHAKQIVKVLGIKNSHEYRERYKEHSQLPAHPDRKYRRDWIDWFDFLDIVKPYTYSEASKLVRENNISTQAEYRHFIANSKNPRMPRSPDQVYSSNWKNWYVFLGKEEPYQINFIHEPYTPWASSLNLFFNTARGGHGKKTNLCKFIRQYIQVYELGLSPMEFLTNKNSINRQDFYRFLENLHSDISRQKMLSAINQFLDYILRTELTLEDEESGELVCIDGARNPFINIDAGVEYINSQFNETPKPALAYQYVENVRKWIIPQTAKYFSDLKHIQIFDADWISVEPNLIDKKDPDCVYKEKDGKTWLWFPAYWIHTYVLVSVPARGGQIAYNDSGEADEYIPELVNGELVWFKNTLSMSGMTQNQGFIKRYPNDQCGMHFTSNKTSIGAKGYDVPWIPHDLIEWLIKLRKWQTKYNSINEPTLWLDCVRTNLNEKQLKSKGANCFLFREFGEKECGHYSGRLSVRLAAALFNSQPDNLKLAELNGDANILSHHSSSYTPHSMRVSLITAYFMEFGLPIEIIMKVVGHANIIMSIYYLKIRSEDLRQRFEEGEKLALKNNAYAVQRMIEQNRIDDLKHELISNSNEMLNSLSNDIPIGNFLFRDYGICPVGALRCSDGGEIIGNTQARTPVPNGYLGTQNCVRCRHFVTGPAFIGGLLSLCNEISLQANYEADKHEELQSKTEELDRRIEMQDEAEYDAIKVKVKFDETERNVLQLELRKTKSEEESSAKKLDMFLCDMQAISKLINQCQILINMTHESDEGKDSLQLITSSDHELNFTAEETSRFQQLCEVCENAEIYESASADLAISPRSQMLDKMSAINNLEPKFYLFTQKQQLFIGNQMVKLLLKRLKTWENINDLIDGYIRLEDLPKGERITRRDIESLFQPHSINKESLLS